MRKITFNSVVILSLLLDSPNLEEAQGRNPPPK